MLQGLQNLVGTSMAAVFSDLDVEEEMTIVQSVSGGPRARGSALGLAGGKGWRLRGRIYTFAVSSNLPRIGLQRLDLPQDCLHSRARNSKSKSKRHKQR